MNIIAVDWQKGSAGLDYIRAAANTEIVGRMIGSLVKLMVSQGASTNNVHLIGFSLGAQVSGHAGEWMKTMALQVSRITGILYRIFFRVSSIPGINWIFQQVWTPLHPCSLMAVTPMLATWTPLMPSL
jgi:hypothetical protein